MATEIERGGIDLGGPHEPSYYEIALTNRQVVVAFIGLLVCLVAAFFSGVWIGRESSTRALAQFARATPPASPGAEGAAASGTAAERPDGQALQEFKFFNDQKKPATPAETRAARRARERALTPSGGTPEAPAAVSEAPSGVPPRQAAAPAATPSGPSAARSRASSRASSPSPEPSGEGEPLPAPARPAPSAAGSAAAEPQLPAAGAAPATPPAAETPRRGRKSAAAPGEGAAGTAGDGGRAGAASTAAGA